MEFEPNGIAKAVNLDRSALAQELKVHLRDIRLLDATATRRGRVALLARPQAILFCAEGLRVAIQSNRALIFGSPAFLPQLEEHLKNSCVSQESSSGTGKVRFEHVVLEGALNLSCARLHGSLAELGPAISRTLRGLRAEASGPPAHDALTTQTDELLPLKNRLDELRQRVTEVRRVLTEVLDNDEDMKMLHLGPLHRPDNDLQLEMMLENYLGEVELVTAALEDLADEVVNTEENLELHIDLQRNKIMKFELLLSMCTFVLTGGAVLTGVFGMNLLSGLESQPGLFYVVTLGAAVAMTVAFRLSLRRMRIEKLI